MECLQCICCCFDFEKTPTSRPPPRQIPQKKKKQQKSVKETRLMTKYKK